jgi:hypothetical protein
MSGFDLMVGVLKGIYIEVEMWSQVEASELQSSLQATEPIIFCYYYNYH